MSLSIDDTSSSGGYGLEVGSAALNKVVEDRRPVFPNVPGDFGGWVNFNGHDLRDTTALEDNDQGSNTTVCPAAFFPTLNILDNQGVADVGS